jgi:hypothetical protein
MSGVEDLAWLPRAGRRQTCEARPQGRPPRSETAV